MTVPAHNQTELDGALGVLPPSSGSLYTVVGCSSSGPLDTPATFARVVDLVASFGNGPMVEAAAHAISTYGGPVLVVRAAEAAGNEGAMGAVDDSDVTGTSVITATAAAEPLDDYDVVGRVILGGTIGTGPITLQFSLDGGRTWLPKVELDTADTYAIPGAGVSFDFAAGTLVTGDEFSSLCSAPLWDSTSLGTALDALGLTSASWEIVHVVGPLTSSDASAIDAKILGLASKGKLRAWIGHARNPTPGETEAAYLSSLSTAFSSFSTIRGAITAGAVQTLSGVSGRKYVRPFSFVAAPREASVSQQINTAALALGPLPSAIIKDENGNPSHHDEYLFPGLDDARFYVARSWEGRAGTYVNRPRLFSSETSDFQLMPHRRVMNLARTVSRSRMEFILNSSDVAVDPTTGFIRESVARAIEADVTAVLEAALLGARPKASGVSYVVSRTDNLLSTRTMRTQLRVIPLAYVEFIEEEDAFENPALRVTGA